MATAAPADTTDDQAVVDLMPSTDAATASVTFRRTKGRDSLKRLSDILSAYMPVRGRDAQQQQPLLEAPREDESSAAASPPVSPGGSGGRSGYRTLKLLDIASLRTKEFNSRENLLLDGQDDAPPAVASGDLAIAEGDISGVALSKSGFAFLTFRESANILRLEIRPKQRDTPVSKTCRVMQVKLRGGATLVPTDIKAYSDQLFVCGHLSRQVEDRQVTLSAMVRCDMDCHVEQASRELPQPRFFGFDMDPVDGQLVVASPTPDGKAAQIFKMSSDFKRKLFKIQLGSHVDSWNRPEFVACLGGGSNQCWVAAQQSDSRESGPGQVKHRLLSFPLRPLPPSAEQQQPLTTKAWMKVSSWKFEGIQPGRLMAVSGGGGGGGGDGGGDSDGQGEQLLMLSRDQGNIYCISEKLGCCALTHPASEGGQSFTGFCCLQETRERPAASPLAVDILATTRDSLYLLQAS